MDEFDLVIFDCDGVLVDSEVLSCRCLVDTLAQYGVAVDLAEVFDRFLGRTFSAVEDHYRAVTGAPMPARFQTDLRARVAASFRTSLQLIPGVRPVLDAMDRPYCLATSSDAERLGVTLEVTRLAPYFRDRIFNAAMVTRGKPAPDLFLFAAERMSKAPARTLVIEDSAIGVAAGKAAGMTVWGFTGGSHHRGRDGRRVLAEAGADRVFASMSELARGRVGAQ